MRSLNRMDPPRGSMASPNSVMTSDFDFGGDASQVLRNQSDMDGMGTCTQLKAT